MTISIKGVPSKFNQNELEQRQASYRKMYKSTMECREAVKGELPHQFLLSVIEHSNKGYTLDVSTPLRLESLNYRAFMTKPDHMQISDLAAADIKIKNAYVAELEAEHERYKELLKAQLLESDAIKEQKKLDAIKAKRLAEIDAEVASCFGKLEIPE